MWRPTRKVSVHTPAILRTPRQDHTPRLVRLTAIEKGKKSCEVGIENVTEAEEGAQVEVYRGPDPRLGGRKLEEAAATARRVPLAQRCAVVLTEDPSRIPRRPLHLDEDHGLFRPLRHGQVGLSTIDAKATRDHDLRQDFRKRRPEIAVCRAQSRLHRAAGGVVQVIRDHRLPREEDGIRPLTALYPDHRLGEGK
jgi:hypothetical protein